MPYQCRTFPPRQLCIFFFSFKHSRPASNPSGVYYSRGRRAPDCYIYIGVYVYIYFAAGGGANRYPAPRSVFPRDDAPPPTPLLLLCTEPRGSICTTYIDDRRNRVGFPLEKSECNAVVVDVRFCFKYICYTFVYNERKLLIYYSVDA